MSKEGNKILLAWLEEKSAQIKDLETKAHEALYTASNRQKHKELMVQKAETLGRMYLEVQKYSKDAETKMAETVRSTLSGYSRNAMQSLELDSVFYMSALLYPDEHVAGEPNNLEKLIVQARALAEL